VYSVQYYKQSSMILIAMGLCLPLYSQTQEPFLAPPVLRSIKSIKFSGLMGQSEFVGPDRPGHLESVAEPSDKDPVIAGLEQAATGTKFATSGRHTLFFLFRIVSTSPTSANFHMYSHL